MLWDKVAGVYDFIEDKLNGRVYGALGTRTAEYVSENDIVLECACGTGAITADIARKCRRLIAVDLSSAMMREAEAKCRGLDNVIFRKADIMHLNCDDNKFDKVVAGNVIHLLNDAPAAVREMLRVCKKGGRLIIPTYINSKETTGSIIAKACGLIGIRFTQEFTFESYKEFFHSLGLDNTEFFIISGRVSCAVAVITKE